MAFSFLIVDDEPYFLIAFLSATCLFFRESWTEYPYFFKSSFFNGGKYFLGFFYFALKLLLLTPKLFKSPPELANLGGYTKSSRQIYFS
jgi:hypothetical protein